MEIKTGYTSLNLPTTSSNTQTEDNNRVREFETLLNRDRKKLEKDSNSLTNQVKDEEKETKDEDLRFDYGNQWMIWMNQSIESTSFPLTFEQGKYVLDEESILELPKENGFFHQMKLNFPSTETESNLMEVPSNIMFNEEMTLFETNIETPLSTNLNPENGFSLMSTSLKNTGEVERETFQNIINREEGAEQEMTVLKSDDFSDISVNEETSVENVFDFEVSEREVESPQPDLSIEKEGQPLSMTSLVDDEMSVSISKTSKLPFPTLDSYWINQEDILNQMIEKMKLLKEGDSTRMVLKLHPRSLGDMQIELSLDKGLLHGRIVVESQEVKQMVERAIQQQLPLAEETQLSVDIDLNFNQSSFSKEHQEQGHSVVLASSVCKKPTNYHKTSEEELTDILIYSSNRVRLVI